MNVINQIQLAVKRFLNFCLDNKIKLIYSATSATLGKKVMIKICPRMRLQNQKIWSYLKI